MCGGGGGGGFKPSLHIAGAECGFGMGPKQPFSSIWTDPLNPWRGSQIQTPATARESVGTQGYCDSDGAVEHGVEMLVM